VNLIFSFVYMWRIFVLRLFLFCSFFVMPCLSAVASEFSIKPTLLHINSSNCSNFLVKVQCLQIENQVSNNIDCIRVELLFPLHYLSEDLFSETNVFVVASSAVLTIPDSMYIPLLMTERVSSSQKQDAAYVSFVVPSELIQKMFVLVTYKNTIMKIALDSWVIETRAVVTHLRQSHRLAQ